MAGPSAFAVGRFNPAVDVEIAPEPEPEEREALLAALESDGALDEPAEYRSEWRRAALAGDDDGADVKGTS